MGDDEGATITFDEVLMQDMVDTWSEQYAEGVTVSTWYFDCGTGTVLIRLKIEEHDDE